MKKFSHTFFLSIFALGVSLLLGTPLALAYVASSTNYRIQSDSVNTGGALSTSPSYRAEDTLGEPGTGTSSSATFALKAGYQQMHGSYLAISAPGNITLAPSIPSSGGGVANGSATWTVTTDNEAGYTMSIQASSTPALVSGVNSFANYIPVGADPDFAFTTPAAASRFGFTPEGVDIVQKYKDNGASCNTGSLDTANACWDPLLTSADTVAARTLANHPTGSATTIRFRAESGTSNTQAAGLYVATTTITVFAL